MACPLKLEAKDVGVDGSHSPVRDEDRAEQWFRSCRLHVLPQQVQSPPDVGFRGFLHIQLHQAEAASPAPAHHQSSEEHS